MGHALGNNYGKFYSFQSKPVLLDLNFIVDSTNGNGLGVRSVKGQGVQNVFMHTSSTPGKGPNGFLNPNPAVGFALIQLAYNYHRVYGGPYNINSPTAGSNLAINASALTIGQPYIITSVGTGTAGAATIAPVGDSSGSLASTWFSLYDAYGNTFIIWFYVTGVGGSAPIGVSGTLVQQTIAENASAATVGTALASTIALLPSGIAGVNSFTTTGSTTVTVTSTTSTPLNGVPADGLIPTTFTFALTKYLTNIQDWQGVGLPAGVLPAVGASFVATATGISTGGGSTGTVMVPGVSGIFQVETIGDPNQSLRPGSLGVNGKIGPSAQIGGWVLIQFLAPTVSGSAYDTPMIPTAPANNSVISLQMLLEQGSRVGGNQE
jgi:hypothetical protein